MRPSCDSSGFTLIEVLIALAIGALVCASMYTSFFSVTSANVRVRETLTERDAQVLSFFAKIEKELNSAFYVAADAKTWFRLEDRDSYGKPASKLSFTYRGMSGTSGSGVIAVAYEANGADNLTLSKTVVDPFSEEKGVPYPLIDKAASFKVECGDGAKWVGTWDTALNGAMPRQIRIRLDVSSGGDVRRFEEVYDICARKQ